MPPPSRMLAVAPHTVMGCSFVPLVEATKLPMYVPGAMPMIASGTAADSASCNSFAVVTVTVGAVHEGLLMLVGAGAVPATPGVDGAGLAPSNEPEPLVNTL